MGLSFKVTQVNISQDGSKVAPKWQIEFVKVDSKNETETWTINRWVEKEVVELKSTRKVKDGKYLLLIGTFKFKFWLSSSTERACLLDSLLNLTPSVYCFRARFD